VAAFLYFGRRFLHTQKHGEKACSQVHATFLEKDGVLGEMEKPVVWHQTGQLTLRNERIYFTLNGKKSISYNQKSKPKTAIVLTAIVFTVAVVRIFLAFFGII
jgi:hypothetical protein